MTLWSFGRSVLSRTLLRGLTVISLIAGTHPSVVTLPLGLAAAVTGCPPHQHHRAPISDHHVVPDVTMPITAILPPPATPSPTPIGTIVRPSVVGIVRAVCVVRLNHVVTGIPAGPAAPPHVLHHIARKFVRRRGKAADRHCIRRIAGEGGRRAQRRGDNSYIDSAHRKVPPLAKPSH